MPPLYILALGLLLLHTPRCSSSAPAGDTLTEGQVLAVGDKLVLRNGKFALGFFQPATSTINRPPGRKWVGGDNCGVMVKKERPCYHCGVMIRGSAQTSRQVCASFKSGLKV
ncbi:uncharacterized protein LOC119299318 [Triticum dicoccoides]|uniref:uncharacterized protein LOC119299318 n=1 Tax=Triticum dicoccoides TaxID=85692 RepID=UPI0018907CA6|nr:uncharacterized protein LOC119299318 [Triticum dicoccoides]